MPIRAIIFDFGGVLVRTEDPSGRRKWEVRLGLPAQELAGIVFGCEMSFRAMRGLVPETAVWDWLAGRFGLKAAEMREFQRDFWAGDRLDPVLVQFLRELRPRYRTAILSNAWANARRVFTQKYRLGEVVDEMIISAEEGAIKPDPRIYRIALERLGVRPAEAVFVDDVPENVQGARALGVRGVQFRDTAQALAEVRKYLDGPPG
jgi:epoxide hydrolase-like predicted phosphatase